MSTIDQAEKAKALQAALALMDSDAWREVCLQHAGALQH